MTRKHLRIPAAFFRTALSRLAKFLWRYRLQVGALLLIAAWCAPYIATGQKIEWGDFSFFAQAHEAMRISIVEYHQFPWFNPWISGGVPLYANPQMGVFSISLLFTLFFGAPLGLKLGLIVYTLAGFGSMYLLLRKYFKIDHVLCTLLGLIWVFGSFFVAHLPAHYTFAWYMLTPLFVYLSLVAKDWRGGVRLGLAFAVMALAQVHNPFVHISLICGVILVVRAGWLLHKKLPWWQYVWGVATAAGVFGLLAGHRVLMTLQNLQQFPREVIDPAPHPLAAILGPLLPFSMANPLHFLDYPKPPAIPHGWHETTATIGLCALTAVLICGLWVIHQFFTNRRRTWREFRLPLVVLGIGLVCASLAFGSVTSFAPYSLLKMLPVLENMRVPMRWFLFFDLALLIFTALVIRQAGKRSFIRFGCILLLTLGVVELFALNIGYQKNILFHQPVTAPLLTKDYRFEQTAYFGQDRQLPGGGKIPNDGSMPDAYREYEATTYNLGVLYANDALVQLALDPRPSPTCPWEEGCAFVLSKNAKVTYWSPQKIVLQRTAAGPIALNANNSSYFLINGKRDTSLKVAEPFREFTINEPDSTTTITIDVKPSLTSLLR